MKFPLNWIRDYVAVPHSAEELAKRLTLSGFEVSAIDSHNGQPVLTLEILANRPDCLSVIGLSREISVLTGKPLKLPKTKIKEAGEPVAKKITVQVQNKKLCPRYTARVIEGVTVGPSPDWLKERLESAGIRSINNIVDVTNFVLLETGQPLHAFDMNLLQDKKIVVRSAQPGEKITTLDGMGRALTVDDLVIADGASAIALAGVMGGANTEITERTTRVLLESAYFEPHAINRTSRRLKIKTESSMRFEEGVDWNGVLDASNRAADLIVQVAGGTIAKGLIDLKAGKPMARVISLSAEKMNQYLGSAVSAAQVKKILKGLGCGVTVKKAKGAESYRVSIPSHRLQDLVQDVDLIEEVARLAGYDRIGVTLPPIIAPAAANRSSYNRLAVLRERLTALGLTEVVTMSLTEGEFQKRFRPGENPIEIANPLTPEESFLRLSLLPGLLKVLQHNLNRQIPAVHIFEVGNIFHQVNGVPGQTLHLAGVFYGPTVKEPWRASSKQPSDFYTAKSIVESTVSFLGVEGDWKPGAGARTAVFHPGKSELFVLRNAAADVIGTVGEAAPELQKALDLPDGVILFGLALDSALKEPVSSLRVQPVPAFPAVRRDINVTAPSGLTHEKIKMVIAEHAGPYLEDVVLIDKYQTKLTYRLSYRNPTGSLTDDEVNAAHANVQRAVETLS